MLSGFSRVPVEVVSAAAAAGVSRPALVLVLLLRYQREDAQGRLYGSMPRSEMAEVLGCSESDVRWTVRHLVSVGLLSVKQPGHGGRATEYYIAPEARKGCIQCPSRGAVSAPPIKQ